MAKAKAVDSITDFKSILTTPSRFGELAVAEIPEMSLRLKLWKRLCNSASSVVRSLQKKQECKCTELKSVEKERDNLRAALSETMKRVRVYTNAPNNVEALRRITK